MAYAKTRPAGLVISTNILSRAVGPYSCSPTRPPVYRSCRDESSPALSATTAKLAYCRNVRDQPIDVRDNFLVSLFPVEPLFRFGIGDPARFAYIGD